MSISPSPMLIANTALLALSFSTSTFITETEVKLLHGRLMIRQINCGRLLDLPAITLLPRDYGSDIFHSMIFTRSHAKRACGKRFRRQVYVSAPMAKRYGMSI